MDGGKLSADLELVEGAEPEKMKNTNIKQTNPLYSEGLCSTRRGIQHDADKKKIASKLFAIGTFAG